MERRTLNRRTKHRVRNQIKSGERGFTLIELVAVIAVMSLMLAFAIPKLSTNFFTDGSKEISRWIMVKVETLKDRALREGKVYILNIDMGTQTMWITGEGMDEEAALKAQEEAERLPEDFRISDVEFPDRGRMAVGQVQIRFYPKGYSDKAMIHIQDEDFNPVTFVIEPFLPKVKRLEEDVGYNG